MNLNLDTTENLNNTTDSDWQKQSNCCCTGKIRSLMEAVADIAYTAGELGWFSGDSRRDVSSFIEWAKEFEQKNSAVKWGIDKDYIEEIQNFAVKKIELDVPSDTGE